MAKIIDDDVQATQWSASLLTRILMYSSSGILIAISNKLDIDGL